MAFTIVTNGWQPDSQLIPVRGPRSGPITKWHAAGEPKRLSSGTRI